MLLSRDKIKLLLEALVLTRDDEVDCDYCFEQLAAFAEIKLAGCSVPNALAAIDRHLQMCGDCAEEFQLLKESIAAVDDDLTNPSRN